MLLFYIHGFDFSRSVFLLDGFLTLLLTAGLRIGIRSLYEVVGSAKGREGFSWSSFRARSNRKKNVLIVGAGSAGEKVLREIFDNPDLEYRTVGFLDDDAARQGRLLHGVPVLGSVEKLPAVVEKHRIHEVFITLPSATGRDLRRIVEICKDCNVSYKALPRLGHIMDGKVSIKALRDVNYEDLLGRPPPTSTSPASGATSRGRRSSSPAAAAPSAPSCAAS